MKKLLSITFAAALCATAAVCSVGCGNNQNGKKYTVYAPDGAPALSLCNGIAKEGDLFDYRVIDAATVQAQVTGKRPVADFCVLPVNLASKLLGSGETYQMLGTVTNGNLYFLSTGDNPVLTAENLKSTLVGKTLGSVQLTNVPGLTLQAVLKDQDIPYQVIENVNSEKAQDKVNVLNLGTDASNVPGLPCDYYLCPEPAVSAKIKATANGGNPLKLAGDLQTLYGGTEGYPQAVLVAKKSVLESDKQAAETLISYFEGSAAYLASATPADLVALLDGKRDAGLMPSFNGNNLTAEVVARCSVRYTPAKDCKARVNAFLAKLKAVNANAASEVADEFYYGA